MRLIRVAKLMGLFSFLVPQILGLQISDMFLFQTSGPGSLSPSQQNDVNFWLRKCQILSQMGLDAVDNYGTDEMARQMLDSFFGVRPSAPGATTPRVP